MTSNGLIHETLCMLRHGYSQKIRDCQSQICPGNQRPEMDDKDSPRIIDLF